MRTPRVVVPLFLLVPLLGACAERTPTESASSRPAAAKLATQYERIDLGTAGGVRAQATDINVDGVIVGWSEDAQGRRRPFRAHVSRRGEVSIEPLVLPPNCASAQVDAINDHGLMIGSLTSDPDAGCGDSVTWTHGAVHLTFQGGCNETREIVSDVNNRGTAVVSIYTGAVGQVAFCYGRVGGPAEFSAGQDTRMDALNDHGIGVGSVFLSTMERPVALDLRCANQPACRRLLPVPAGAAGAAAGINERGQIVGNLVLPNGTRRGAGWDLNNDGTYDAFDLGDTGTHEINNGGVIAGFDLGTMRAVALHLASRTRIELPVPAGSTGSAATAVNDRNEFVGWYYDLGTKRAALWRPVK